MDRRLHLYRKQTIDGDTAQVRPGIAKRLGLLRLTYGGKIRALDLTVRTIQTERRAEGGVQVLLTRPYLITILGATTRFAAAPWRMRYETPVRQS